MSKKRVLIIEAFYGGSHKQLTDFLTNILETNGYEVTLLSLPDKKWHWRARTSALYFSQRIPVVEVFDFVFTSSVLNLSELCALRPDLIAAKKIIYFHENQLSYPVKKEQERDFQYGYNQILSCLVADLVLFNSKYNMDSFLSNLGKHFKLQPDHRPDCVAIREQLAEKCQVMHFPIEFPPPITEPNCVPDSEPLHIVWPHRWEHDKNPEAFFKALFQLQELGIKFKVSVLGQKYCQIPEVFQEAEEQLSSKIVHWGYAESKDAYFDILRSADVVVSTANHEFFGVAMLEAVFCGCYPLVPNRLVYPELYPKSCLYNTDQQLFKRLLSFCKSPRKVIIATKEEIKKILEVEKFSAQVMTPLYLDLF